MLDTSACVFEWFRCALLANSFKLASLARLIPMDTDRRTGANCLIRLDGRTFVMGTDLPTIDVAIPQVNDVL